MDKFEKTSEPIFYKKKPRRSLSKKQKSLIALARNKFLFKKFKNKSKKKYLEIGFGYGENLINLAKKNNDKIILGCEVYEPGISNLVDRIEKEKIQNIFIYPKNIFFLLKKLEKNSIHKIFLLFPDPWPKKKHHKRRMVSKFLIEKLRKILVKNGLIILSTDSKDYLYLILEQFFKNLNFLWIIHKPKNCFIRPKELIESKYEKKANKKGSTKYFLKFKKIC